jgi:hypothetical protein
VHGERGSPGDEQGAEDPFDRRVQAILVAEEDRLQGYAEQLVTTGAICIERQAGTVTARLSRPGWRYRGVLSWHRRPGLEIEAVAADGSYRSGAHGPMAAKYHDRVGMIREVVLQLAFLFAALDEEAADGGRDGGSGVG